MFRKLFRAFRAVLRTTRRIITFPFRMTRRKPLQITYPESMTINVEPGKQSVCQDSTPTNGTPANEIFICFPNESTCPTPSANHNSSIVDQPPPHHFIDTHSIENVSIPLSASDALAYASVPFGSALEPTPNSRFLTVATSGTFSSFPNYESPSQFTSDLRRGTSHSESPETVGVTPRSNETDAREHNCESIDMQDVIRHSLQEHGLEIVERLGDGGMGVVVSAIVWSPELFIGREECPRHVAVKIIQKQHGESRQVMDEISLHTNVSDDPNVASLYQSFEDSLCNYMVMERLYGCDIAQYLDEKGQLPEGHALKIMEQAFSVVSNIHLRKIAHRDLKPANFMFRSSPMFAWNFRPDVRLIDFGLGYKCDLDESVNDYVCDDTCGTPFYTAPEVSGPTYYAPGPSDVWSLGIMMFELITGRVPYTASSFLEVANMAREDTLKSLDEYEDFARLSSGSKHLIRKCLSLHPTGRPSCYEAYETVKTIREQTTKSGRLDMSVHVHTG